MWNNSLLSNKQTDKENIDQLVSIPVAAMLRAITSGNSVEIKEGIFILQNLKKRHHLYLESFPKDKAKNAALLSDTAQSFFYR